MVKVIIFRTLKLQVSTMLCVLDYSWALRIEQSIGSLLEEYLRLVRPPPPRAETWPGSGPNYYSVCRADLSRLINLTWSRGARSINRCRRKCAFWWERERHIGSIWSVLDLLPSHLCAFVLPKSSGNYNFILQERFCSFKVLCSLFVWNKM